MQVKKPKAGEIAKHPASVAGLDITRRRCDGIGFEYSDTRAAQTAHKIDILHDRPGPKAAKIIVKPPGDQQTLIAVGQPEHPGAPVNTPRQPPCPGAIVIERKAKNRAACSIGRVLDKPGDRRLPTGHWHRIAMQEQQPVATRRFGPGGKLAPTPRRTGNHPRTVGAGNPRRRILRPPIGDDDFADQPTFARRCQRAQGGGEPFFGIQSRDDYA